ncbi:MAG: hypothetical protein J6A04_06760 [Clostridia bacterium]|nr:hypothetical protein [Clostridia bacterium]
MKTERILRVVLPTSAEQIKETYEKRYGKDRVLVTYDPTKDEYEIKVLSDDKELER